MRLSNVVLALGCICLFLMIAPAPAEAQIWDRVKKSAKETVEREAEEKTENAVEGAIDGTISGLEKAAKCIFTDTACIEKAEENGQTVVMTDAEGEVIRDERGQPVTDPEVAQAQQVGSGAQGETAPQKPGEGVWANYDFVPGERVLFTDDFSDEYVGDFPRRLSYVRGNIEVVEWEGRRLLRGTGNDRFIIQIPEGLPEQYTLEFDIHDPTTGSGTDIYPVALGESDKYSASHRINIGSWRGSGVWNGGPVSTNAIDRLEEEVIPIRVSVDRGYVKIYARERRIANVPQVDFPAESTGITFHLHSRTDRPIYLGDISVAAGGRTRIYETLSAEGRVVTHGILFDTGSDVIRPESTPTLSDIGRTLQQHEDLRLRIEGHTDDTGTPESNQELSQRRAEAVRVYLMEQFTVAPDRLMAVGMGESTPAAPNDTEEGRQTNRRVELVQL